MTGLECQHGVSIIQCKDGCFQPQILNAIADMVIAYRPKAKRKKPRKEKVRSSGGRILAKVKRAKREDQIAVFEWLKKRSGV